MTQPHYIDRGLLPCPFCGGSPRYSVEGFMFCDCGAAGPVAPIEGEPGMARRDAIAAWNRRPAPMEAVAWREKVARLLCEQRGLDPDEHVIGGQATNFEDFGPRWQAARHGHFYGFHDYEEDADAILALIATHPVQGGEG